MKVLANLTIILSLSVLLFSCGESYTPTKERDPIVQTVVDDVTNIMKIESDAPILDWKLLALEQADKIIYFDINNVDTVFHEIKKNGHYRKVFLTTGDHTLVELGDMKDCVRSRSWMTCMPSGRGYIKKIEMKYTEDMVNNIIGLPDRQERIAYYFY